MGILALLIRPRTLRITASYHIAKYTFMIALYFRFLENLKTTYVPVQRVYCVTEE